MEKKTKQIVLAVTLAVAVTMVIAIGAIWYNAPTRRISRMLDLGQEYLLAEDYENAIATYRDILTIDPKNEAATEGALSAYSGWGDALSTEARYEEAIIILDEAVIALPQSEELLKCMADIYILWGNNLLEAGELSQANSVFAEGYEKTSDERLLKYIESRHEDDILYSDGSFEEQYLALFESVYNCCEKDVFGKRMADWTIQEATSWIEANADGKNVDGYYDSNHSWRVPEFDSNADEIDIIREDSGWRLYDLLIWDGTVAIWANFGMDINDIPYLNDPIDQIFSDNDALELLETGRAHCIVEENKTLDVYKIQEQLFLRATYENTSVTLSSYDEGNMWFELRYDY